MTSWLQSANNWIASRRLQKYGFALCNLLKGIGAKQKAKEESKSGDEVGVKSFQSIDEVQEIIRYHFNDKSLLYQAFSHPSCYSNCASYERLEYVGDSVLNLLITKQQFSLYPNLPPGLLTPLRAANVDTEKLARVAIKHRFHEYLRHGKPILRKRIEAFVTSIPKYPVHSHGLINAPKVLADVVESTIGAVFVDCNYSLDTTWKVAEFLLEPVITPEMLQMNPLKKLLELCQKFKLQVRFVDLWEKQGAYEVFVDGQIRGRGMCHSKKEIALNRAANNAYNRIIQTLGVNDLIPNPHLEHKSSS